MEDVYYHPEEFTQQMLGDVVSNIKPDRTDLDLLYACLLDWGVEINLPHTSAVIDDCTVHNVDNGALMACFDKNVPESVIRAMELRGVEDAKIACARAHFAAISNESVIYDVVDSFEGLMNLVS